MPSSSETLLELRDVDFGYGDRLVLSNLNLRFKRGQVVAVMGGSGCGKTTVLRLIGGLVQRPARPDPVPGAGHRRADARRPVRAAPQNGHAVPVRRAVYRHVGVRKRGFHAARAHRSARRADPRPGADEAQRGRPAWRARPVAGGDFRRHGAARGARPGHRARPRTDDVRRAVRRPRSHFARHHGEPDPHAESGARRHLDSGDARRAGIVRDRRLRVFPRQRRRARRRHAGRNCGPRPIRPCASSSTARRTARSNSTIPATRRLRQISASAGDRHDQYDRTFGDRRPRDRRLRHAALLPSGAGILPVVAPSASCHEADPLCG